MIRALALLLVSMAVMAGGPIDPAQQSEDERDRAYVQSLLLRAYMDERAAKYCVAWPNGIVDIEVDYFVIPVDCYFWHQWWRQQQG